MRETRGLSRRARPRRPRRTPTRPSRPEPRATRRVRGPGRGWTAGERLAWERWAPLALLLPGVKRWSAAERRALAAVMRAKGGRRESDFVRAFDAHPKLGAAVARVAREAKA